MIPQQPVGTSVNCMGKIPASWPRHPLVQREHLRRDLGRLLFQFSEGTVSGPKLLQGKKSPAWRFGTAGIALEWLRVTPASCWSVRGSSQVCPATQTGPGPQTGHTVKLSQNVTVAQQIYQASHDWASAQHRPCAQNSSKAFSQCFHQGQNNNRKESDASTVDRWSGLRLILGQRVAGCGHPSRTRSMQENAWALLCTRQAARLHRILLVCRSNAWQIKVIGQLCTSTDIKHSGHVWTFVSTGLSDIVRYSRYWSCLVLTIQFSIQFVGLYPNFDPFCGQYLSVTQVIWPSTLAEEEPRKFGARCGSWRSPAVDPQRSPGIPRSNRHFLPKKKGTWIWLEALTCGWRNSHVDLGHSKTRLNSRSRGAGTAQAARGFNFQGSQPSSAILGIDIPQWPSNLNLRAGGGGRKVV